MNNLHLVFLICIVLFYSRNEILNFLNNENMENIDDDDNPLKSDYTQLIKSTKNVGFSKGDYGSFKDNVKAGKNNIWDNI